MAEWISSQVGNDSAGFCLGENCLKVRVEFDGWILAGGFRLSGFWKSRFRLDDLDGFWLGGFWMGGFWIDGCRLGLKRRGGFWISGRRLGGFRRGGFWSSGSRLGGSRIGGFWISGSRLGGFRRGGFWMGRICATRHAVDTSS